MRSIPTRVLGPVLRPPCSLHRPFGIAGHIHGVPRRFFAPQRAAFEKSPAGLPFRSFPRRFSWGVSLVFVVIPRPPSCVSPGGLPFLSHPRRCVWGSSLVLAFIPGTPGTVTYCPNDGLATAIHMDMLDLYSLLSLAPIGL